MSDCYENKQQQNSNSSIKLNYMAPKKPMSRLVSLMGLASGIAIVLASGLAQASAATAAVEQTSLRPHTIVSHEGTNFSVTPSPDGQTLVMDFHGSLWSLPIQGGAARPMTDWRVEATRPVWSPRGDLIAFQAYIGGMFHVWTIRPDGSDLRQRTFGLSDNREPAWSPDGGTLAFASDRAGAGSYDIWTLNLESGSLVQRTDTTAEEAEPVWSSDGRSIAFVEGGRSIATVDDGGRRTTLVDQADTALSAPTWNPDGELIYLKAKPASGLPGLSIKNHAGRSLDINEDVFPFRPAFLSDGKMIYTADGGIRLRDLSSGRVDNVPFEITETVNRAERPSSRRSLSDTTSRPATGLTSVQPSPDGTTVLIGALADLYIVDQSGAAHPLTRNAYWEGRPVWSADGSAIYYVSDMSGVTRLYRHPVDGSPPEPVTPADMGPFRTAAMSPDERRIAYLTPEGVHLLDRATGNIRLLLPPAVSYAFADQIHWSPDNRMLVVAEKRQFNRRFREGDNLIRLIDTQTGEVRLMPPAPDKSLSDRTSGVGPVWSPDGQWLAFVMDAQIWVMPVASDGSPTGPARAVTENAGDYPSWSADSQRIFYISSGTVRSIGLNSADVVQHPLDLDFTPAAPSGETVIHAGRLWDGTTSEYRRDVDIVVRANQIVEIRPHQSERQSGVTYIDAHDRTVMPGMTDMHVHPSWIDIRPWRSYLAMGITSIVSMGTGLGDTIQRREALDAGVMIGPRLFVTGEMLDGSRINYPNDRVVVSDAQLEREIARLVEARVDFIKTYVRLPAARMERAAAAAQMLGIASGGHYMWPGLEAGQSLTSHLSATSRLGYSVTVSPGGRSYGDVIAAYAEGQLGLVHTPFARTGLNGDAAVLNDPRIQNLVAPGAREMLERLASTPGTELTRAESRLATANVLRIMDAGGLVSLGTDAPLTIPALGFQMDMRLLSESGLSPHQIMTMATVNGHRMLGTSNDLGTIEVGKLADLVIIDGDPLMEISDLIKVDAVMVGGRHYTQEQLLSNLP